MKNEITPPNNKQNSLPEKKKSQQITSHVQVDHKLVWRKEVSAWARLMVFGIYGLICFSIGKKMMDNSAPFEEVRKKTAELSQKIDALKEAKDFNEKFALKTAPSGLSQSELSSLAKVVKQELSELYGARQSADQRLIETQRSRIATLESHLKNLLDEKQSRERVLGVGPTESVPYNSQNLAIMTQEFRLKKKRMEEQLAREKEAFVSLHDMNNWENQNQFEKIQDDHKLILYRLDQEFQTERIEFKKRGHRSPASL